MKDINTVYELLLYADRHYAERDFCRFIRDEALMSRTYKEFIRDAVAVARFIRSRGNRHIHIGFAGITNYEYIACLTGMILSGNTVIPLSPASDEAEASYLINDGDIEILFCDGAFTGTAEKIRERCPALKEIISLGDRSFFEGIFREYRTEGLSPGEFSVDPDKCALIIYTSGTTGNKKGVMLSNRNLAVNSTYDTYRMSEGDVSLSILPMHHVFCYACDVLKTLYDGGTLCLNGELSELFKNFHIFEPTVMRIVPAIVRTVLTRIKIAQRRNPDFTPRQAAESVVGRNLRQMIAGSAFLSAALIDEMSKYSITARQGYGMSECSPRITTSDFSDCCKYSNGILPGTDEVRIRDGEIQVRGPSVMLGYYKRKEETEAAFTEDGFLHTGDMGYIENNHIYLTGRKKNIIVLSNGENISPETIENSFSDNTEIKEIIVFAKDDRICAEIYPERDVTREKIEEIILSVNRLSPAHMQIEEFFIRETPFNKTSTGKIIRQEFLYKE